jgi:acyl-CoA synthetase (AMP-forming)/AMP-acid ligase II
MLDGAPFTVRDALIRAADLYGGEVAVVCGDDVMTWRELVARAHRAAHWLKSNGVSHGQRILVVSDNRLELVELAYGIAELGAVMVPLSPIVAPKEVEQVWHDCEAVLGLFAVGLDRLVDDSDPRWLRFGDDVYERSLEHMPSDEPPLVERPEDIVLQFYTSGTTGRPKGVQMSHGAMTVHGLNTVISQGLTHDDVFLTCTPLTHAAGGTRIFSMATEGIRHVILRRWSAELFFSEVARRRVSTTVLVPAMLRDVVQHDALPQADLSSLRFVVYGAAPTPPDLRREALERLPVGLIHSYGISEGCPALTVLTPAEHAAAFADPALAERLSSVGRPVPGVRIQIADESGARLAVRETGEIMLRNAKAMSGYWHRPEEDDLIWRDGWMATGDLGYTDEEGYLYIVGRKKEMIISGGYNVYPAEIENLLVTHPMVSQAAVIGLAHERWGESVVAFVVPAGAFDSDELQEFCREHLAAYKLPKRFHELEALPVNQLGKVVKTELAEMAAVAAANR